MLSTLLGCSGDETTPIDPGPVGPPSIQIVEPPASPDGEPVCVSLGEDVNTRLPLLVDTDELALRPPGGCPGVNQCGRLALYADGVLNNEGAVQAIDLLVYRIGDPYRDGSRHADTGLPDTLHLRIDVVDEDDEVMRDHDGELLRSVIELITLRDCDAP